MLRERAFAAPHPTGEQRNFASRTACRQCGKARSAPKPNNKQEEVHEVVKTLRRELAA